MYLDLLPFFVVSTGAIGFFSGFISCRSHNFFTNIVGYTGVGLLTGISYPVSYPLLGFYVLYKNKNNS